MKKSIKAMDENSFEKEKNKFKIGQIINYILIPIVCFFLFFSMSIVITRAREGIPKIFGYSLIRITSGSMTDAGFKIGSYAFIKAQKDYEIGNCIAFYDYSDPNCPSPPTIPNGVKPAQKAETKRIVFHEIYSIETDANGEKWFTTKGTNNPNPDLRAIYQSYVIGGFVELRPMTLHFFNFIISLPGVILIVCLPCVAIIVNNAILLKKIVNEKNIDNKNKIEK